MSREGSLDAPTRHPLGWQSDAFYDESTLYDELERVYDICHGCRRCVSLCQSFPVLFELVDNSDTMEVDGVAKTDYMQVVDHCYLCDLCFMTKCPYVPPHEWNVDFPHLMLRAKAVRYKKEGASLRDKTLTSTDSVAKLASIPVVEIAVNTLNNNRPFRSALESTLGVHREALVPRYHSNTLRKRALTFAENCVPQEANGTTGKIALFATCYGNYNAPELAEDFYRVFQHNSIQIELVPREQCCGMPKLELGDLESVARAKEANIPLLAKLVDEGYDLTAPIPSCVLMFKQELPLMFPNDAEVKKVQQAFYDPFEYLALRHKAGHFKTDFKSGLGRVSYQVACHQRVQNIGAKTRDILQLIPDTELHTIERCSGHDGTYAVKKETREHAVKIARPVVKKVDQQQPAHVTSDCVMAGKHIASLAKGRTTAEHPMTLLRQAYGI